MNIFIIIGLVLLGIVFILLELFFVPGISVASIGGLTCFVGATVFAYKISSTVGNITLSAVLVATALSIYLFFRSHILDKMSLKSEINSTVANENEKKIDVGDKGFCVSRLAPSGKILIKGILTEAYAEDEMIDENTSIVVTATDGHRITVRKTQDKDTNNK